jgi:hypothetical protein
MYEFLLILDDVSCVQALPFSIHLASDASLSALAATSGARRLQFHKHVLLSKCNTWETSIQ